MCYSCSVESTSAAVNDGKTPTSTSPTQEARNPKQVVNDGEEEELEIDGGYNVSISILVMTCTKAFFPS